MDDITSPKRARRIHDWFRCVTCPQDRETETDEGYELPDGRRVCLECYKKYRKEKDDELQ